MERLRCFDIVAVLEDPYWFEQIASGAGWTPSHLHANSTDRSLKMRLASIGPALHRGRLDIAARALRQHPPSATGYDMRRLRALNDLDRRLYDKVAAPGVGGAAIRRSGPGFESKFDGEGDGIGCE